MSNTDSPADIRYRHLNITVLAVLAYLVAAPLVALFFSRRAIQPIELCLSVRILGQTCPLCGWTRGLDALLHGDPITATAMNPLTVPASLLVAANIICRSLILSKRIPISQWARMQRVDLWVHTAAVVVYFGYAVTFYVLR